MQQELKWFTDRIGQTVIMKGQSAIEKEITDYKKAKELYETQPYYTFTDKEKPKEANVCIACEG